MIITKRKLVTAWRYSNVLARHAWRVFIKKPDADTSEMTPPTYQNWVSCQIVWEKLRPYERDVIKRFCQIEKYPPTDDDLSPIAEVCSLSISAVWEIAKKAWKLWAIERGLADKEGGDYYAE